jgi:hypothetical protein
MHATQKTQDSNRTIMLRSMYPYQRSVSCPTIFSCLISPTLVYPTHLPAFCSIDFEILYMPENSATGPICSSQHQATRILCLQHRTHTQGTSKNNRNIARQNWSLRVGIVFYLLDTEDTTSVRGRGEDGRVSTLCGVVAVSRRVEETCQKVPPHGVIFSVNTGMKTLGAE